MNHFDKRKEKMHYWRVYRLAGPNEAFVVAQEWTVDSFSTSVVSVVVVSFLRLYLLFLSHLSSLFFLSYKDKSSRCWISIYLFEWIFFFVLPNSFSSSLLWTHRFSSTPCFGSGDNGFLSYNIDRGRNDDAREVWVCGERSWVEIRRGEEEEEEQGKLRKYTRRRRGGGK